MRYVADCVVDRWVPGPAVDGAFAYKAAIVDPQAQENRGVARPIVEQSARKVAVRARTGGDQGQIPLDQFIDRCRHEIAERKVAG